MTIRRLTREAQERLFDDVAELPAAPLYTREGRIPFHITTTARKNRAARERVQREKDAKAEAKRKAEGRPRSKRNKKTTGITGQVGKRGITLSVNPNEITYQQALRGAQQKTRAGTVYYAWRDPDRRTFFDNPVFTFNFQAGNILPFAYRGLPEYAEHSGTPPVPSGQRDYYEFKGILDESKHLSNGRPNFVVISTNTRIYPALVLHGFFDPAGFSVTHTVDTANTITWSIPFTCRFTYPALHDPAALIASFKDNVPAG